MTTETAARLYAAQHMAQWFDKGYVVSNPEDLPLDELPFIVGFDNTGEGTFRSALAIAEDGTVLGSHCCSDECYMYHDLGILEGARPDRHETYRAHYPRGYRMDFAKWDDPRVTEAIRLNNAKQEKG